MNWYWKIIFWSNIFILDICVPYTISACINASKHQGLQLGGNGKDFEADHEIKGCHSKDGRAFFGIGGNRFDHQISLVVPNFRPNGFDCGKISNKCY